MKTMKTLEVETWLPKFDGFYSTIWEPDESQEIDSINDERKAKGLPEITFDDCSFDYDDYHLRVCKGIASYLEREMNQFVSGIEVQKVVSPREYNYTNDSCDVVITLDDDNQKAIQKYLNDHSADFADYLRQKYTSCSGFISSYPNTIEDFIGFNLLEALQHQHKLGSILEFIAELEGIESLDIYSNVEVYLSCSNYHELVPE